MKTTAHRTTLIDAISRVIQYVDKAPINPILAHVALDTGGDAFGLTVRGTDLCAFAEASCAAQSSEDDRVTINAQTLLSALRSLPDGEVSIERDGGQGVVVSSGGARFALAAANADDMPVRPVVDMPVSFKMSGPDLSRIFKRALVATNNKDPRPATRGVHLRIGDSPTGDPLVYASGTDGKRLVRVPAKIHDVRDDHDGDESQDAIIPISSASSIADTFAHADVVEVSMGGGRALFASDCARVDTAAVPSMFPDVDQVIPKEFKARFDVVLSDLRRAVAQSAVVCHGDSYVVQLDCSPSGVAVTSAGVDCGEFSTSIRQTVFSGESDLSLQFNIDYLSSLLKLIDGEVVRINANGQRTPVVLGDGENHDSVLLIMPIVTKAR